MRKNQSHAEKTREKIQTSMLLNRLQDHALNDLELSASQIKAIEILLKKTVPDLKQMELSGIDGDAIKTENKWTVEVVDAQSQDS